MSEKKKKWKVGFRTELIEWIEIPEDLSANIYSESEALEIALAIYKQNGVDYIEELISPLDDITIEHSD